MKNTTKKIFAVLSATTIALSASLAMAEEGIMPISAPEETKIFVNEALLDKTSQVVNEQQFLPLRAICETLGFTVNWIEESRKIEIVNLPMYITCSPDRDGYTFAKTAPISLGSAPVLIDDLTYVPTSFVNEIIGYTLKLENDAFYITSEEVTPEATPQRVEVSATIVDLIYDENENLIQIVTGDKEDVLNQLVFNLTEELSAKAKELNLEVGMSFTGEAEALQTMSIPPQQPLLSLTVVDAEDAKPEEETNPEEDVKAETEEIEATIVELVYEDEKLIQIVTGDKEDVQNQLVFNLSEELSAKAAELELKEGMTIKGEAAMMKTMSIPPQQPLLTITEAK